MTPTMPQGARPAVGDRVYTRDGMLVGRVERVGQEGILVEPAEADESAELPTSTADRAYGETTIIWRCGQCGEVGSVESVPDNCPSCDAPREELYYSTED